MIRALFVTAVMLVGCGKHREAVIGPARDTILISVISDVPGVAPDELARRVTVPIELGISQVPSLVGVHSRTTEGRSIVSAEFPAGTDAFSASSAVMKAAQAAERDIAPELAVSPMISRESRAGAVLRLTVTSETLPLLDVAGSARELIAQKLERVAGVARVEVCGPEPETRITVDPVALASAGKTIDDVRTAIEEAGSSGPPAYDQVPIVRDTARVETGAEGPGCVALAGDRRAVAVTVTPQSEADPIEVRERLEAVLPRIAASLPQAMHLDVWPRTRPLAYEVLLHPAAPLARRLDDLRHVLGELHLATRSLVQLGLADRDPDVADLRIVPADPSDALEPSITAAFERQHASVRDRRDHVVRVYGADPNAQQEQVKAIATAVAGVTALHVVEQLGASDRPRVELKIDRDRAAVLQVDQSVVASTLRALAPDGMVLRTSYRATAAPPAVLRVQGELPAVLDQVRVRSRTGNAVPLSSIVTATRTLEAPVIFREGMRRWFGVRVAGSLDALNDILAKLPVPVGMTRELRDPD